MTVEVVSPSPEITCVISPAVLWVVVTFKGLESSSPCIFQISHNIFSCCKVSPDVGSPLDIAEAELREVGNIILLHTSSHL